MEENSGSGDLIRRVAEKALFSTLFGHLTQKTLARVYNLFFGSIDSGLRTPG
jgi:hypothetical protein